MRLIFAIWTIFCLIADKVIWYAKVWTRTEKEKFHAVCHMFRYLYSISFDWLAYWVHLNEFVAHGQRWTFSSLLSEQFGIPSQIFFGSVALKFGISFRYFGFVQWKYILGNLLQESQATALSWFIASIAAVIDTIAELIAWNAFVISASQFVSAALLVCGAYIPSFVTSVTAIDYTVA